MAEQIMTRDELIERLQAFEWNDIEFKEAGREVSKDAFPTVSAFSNTAGGVLVFGVKHENGRHEIVGVIEVDKVQNDFLSALRSDGKVSKAISATEGVIKDGDATLLVFRIPEARRQDKPIYLHGDIRQSFIRRGGGDEKCRKEEIEAFLRDASAERYDCEAVEADPETFFDPESLRWYRRLFDGKNPGNETIGHSDTEFLHEWGLLLEHGDRLFPTRAAVLLFGRGAVVRQHLPRPVVDVQWLQMEWGGTLPDERWSDRVVIEENLIRAWQRLVQKFIEHSQAPFQIDPASLRRDDMPPDYLAFREATINLLTHQDFADHNRKPGIHFYRDRTVFSNPGDLFADPDQLLEPVEKPVRNPRIVGAFRRIGLSEQAGTGFRTIFRAWDRLGHVPPVVENDKGRKAFTLHLPRERLLSEEQLLFQASLGVRLSETEAKAFAAACRTGELRVLDVKGITGLSTRESLAVIDRLLVEVLVEEVAPGNRAYVRVREHLVDRMSHLDLSGKTDGSLVSDQAPANASESVTDQPVTNPAAAGGASAVPLQRLSETQRQIVRMCDVYRTMADLMGRLGMTHRTFFRRNHLEPLLRGGVLKMKHPEQPNHPQQAYVVTEAGVALVERLAQDIKNEGKTT
jgi:ATP-dependent DNA helicase RecG